MTDERPPPEPGQYGVDYSELPARPPEIRLVEDARSFLSILLAAMLVFVLSSVAALQGDDWYAPVSAGVGVIAIAGLIALTRSRRLRTARHIQFACAVLALISLGVLVNILPFVILFLVLPMIIIVIASLARRRRVFLWVAACVAILAVAGISVTTGILQPEKMGRQIWFSAYDWLIYLAMATLLMGFIVLFVDRYRRRLESILIDLRYRERVLANLNAKLSASLVRASQLESLLPICAACNKIQAGDGHWVTLDEYLESRLGIKIVDIICPECGGSSQPSA